MAKLNYRKSLGWAICSFYGAYVFARFFQIIINAYEYYNPTLNNIVWIVIDLVCCAAMCYLTFSKTLKLNNLSRIGSGILAAIYALFALNVSLYYANTNIFSFLGDYAGVIFAFIQLNATCMLFLTLNTWTAVKISALIYWIPAGCGAFYFSKLIIASRLVESSYDYYLVENLWNNAQTCENIAAAISIITVIITIVWTLKKPANQQINSNTLDII